MKTKLLSLFAITALLSLSGCTNVAPSPINPDVVTLDSISVSGQKTQYTVGEDFVTPTVTATYSDQSTKDVTASTTFTGFDSSAAVESQTINAFYTENSVTKSTSFTVSIVSSVDPTPTVVLTSISISGQKTQYEVGDTFVQPTVTATYSNQTTRDVTARTTFTGFNSSAATTSQTITASYSEGSVTKNASYNIVITAKVTPTPGTDSEYAISFKNNSSDSNRALTNIASEIEQGASYVSSVTGSYVYAGKTGVKLASRNNEGNMTITLASSVEIKTIVAHAVAYGSDKPTLKINNVQASVTTEQDYTFNYSGSEANQLTITATKRLYLKSLTITAGPVTPVDPTSISISSNSIELSPGKSSALTIEYSPKNANQNKEIEWKSSDPSIASVSSTGVVTADASASAGQTAVITAKLKNLSSVPAVNCTVKIVETQKAEWTVMLYMCGADLESQNHFATADLKEILSVGNQPDDVNFIIETGGASSWQSGLGIQANKLGRWEVRNKQLNNVSQLTYASMGLTSTLQSFFEWGLTEYPANKTALILWNHGGALDGVCFDEKKGDDSLLASEVEAAVSGARSKLGITEKFEWIGYDACLMQVQDIAEINSKYFNYMVAAEESEAGEGWEYSTWVDDLYAKKATKTILQAVCDGFVTSFDKQYPGYDNDQTLSFLDLSYMAQYKTAFESFASSLSSAVNSYGKSNFKTLIGKNVKHYADTWMEYSDYQQYIAYGYSSSWFTTEKEGGKTYYCLVGYYLYGTFDVVDFLNVVNNNSSFSSLKSSISSLKSILNNLIAYNKAGNAAGNSNGLCCVFDAGDSINYPSSETNFTNWRSFAA